MECSRGICSKSLRNISRLVGEEMNTQTAVKHLYVYKINTKLVGKYLRVTVKEDIVSNLLFRHKQ